MVYVPGDKLDCYWFNIPLLKIFMRARSVNEGDPMASNVNTSPHGNMLQSEPTHVINEPEFWKPGIYALSKESGSGYKAVYRRNRRVTPVNCHVIVICDGAFENPARAAEDATRSLQKISVGPPMWRDSFDVLYPGHVGSFGKNVTSANSDQIQEAASLLATAMQNAPRDWCIWVSVSGGSAVLSRAMELLVEQGITLEKQIVQLFRPTTSSIHILRLAYQLKMKMPDKFLEAGLLSCLTVGKINILRARHDGDTYTWKDNVQKVLESKQIAVGLIFFGLLIGYVTQR